MSVEFEGKIFCGLSKKPFPILMHFSRNSGSHELMSCVRIHVTIEYWLGFTNGTFKQQPTVDKKKAQEGWSHFKRRLLMILKNCSLATSIPSYASMRNTHLQYQCFSLPWYATGNWRIHFYFKALESSYAMQVREQDPPPLMIHWHFCSAAKLIT